MITNNINGLIFTLTIGLAIGLALTRSNAQAQANPIVLMETSLGNLKIELFAKDAPISVKNFLSYASEGYYTNLIFHRVIPGFMVQGGGFNKDMHQKKTGSPIKNEASNGLKNSRGTLAMARTNVIDSATSQFFINVVNNDFLNHRDNSSQGYGYAVFGKVIEGMDIVDKIAKVSTASVSGYENVPIKPIVIKNVSEIK